MKKIIEIKNKKASFSYTLTENFTAGIQLKGGEVKSIRNKEVKISDSFCIIFNDEIWVKNIYISKYKHDTSESHNPNRNKKLLLNKSEISKIIKSINEKGASLIPTKLFINDKGLVKIQVAIGKGKKMYDKREIIKKETSKNKFRGKKKGKLSFP